MNSQEWWNKTKASSSELIRWLKAQYHGEVTAAKRIRELILIYPANPKWKQTVELIASQEEKHAEWIGRLLNNRGIPAQVLDKKERYWDETIKQITDWETGCAVAAHAEKMRLERIEVICKDETADDDIREVFAKILVEERFHEKSFRSFSSDEAMEKTLAGHLAGLNELGLTP